MDSEDIESIGPQEAGALCCAAALRIGGALGVLAAGAGLGGYYHHVDRGLRRIMLSYRGSALQSDVVSEAFAASWHLGTVFPTANHAARFFQAGLGVADFAMMAWKSEDRNEPLKAALKKALEAARLRPGSLRGESSLDLVGFESACQASAFMHLRHGGIAALSECIEAESQRYRVIAEDFRN